MSVVLSLQKEREEKSDGKAYWTSKVITEFKFLYTMLLYFMMPYPKDHIYQDVFKLVLVTTVLYPT